MTAEQLKARNEAFQLLSIAHRILSDAGLTAYADEVAPICAGMQTDAHMWARAERMRRYPA